MSNQFPHQQIDSKWREFWKKNNTYKPDLRAVLEKEGAESGRLKEKYYALVALPYPSGSGLHVGHMYCFNPVDILARFERMRGKEVILPMGWDSFGLPAENYAVKTGIHPNITTEDAIKNFKWQLDLAGFSTNFESHEIAAHWENYYKWTQWIFIELYKAGLAYRAKAPVNWCPSCQTVLANEQVVNGKCERCENLVIQKDMEQWFMKITDYSERLYQDLDKVDWPESTKIAQRNWIGRSEGAEVDFEVIVDRESNYKSQPGEDKTCKLKVFTTRPDTIYGATFMVIAPEHKMLGEMQEYIVNDQEVADYIDQATLKSQLERESQKEKTGIEVKGIKAINPITKAEIPIFVADYVLNTYGTGAIMAVPAHDERDSEFAKKYNLEFKQVIAKEIGEVNPNEEFRRRVECLVRNQEDKFLMLKWDNGHFTPVSGGIEKEEDIKTAAIRELKEETGYTKVIRVNELDTMFQHFYAANKGLYRCSETHVVVMEVDSSEKVELNLEENEKGRFETLWVTKDEYLKLVDHDSKDLFDQIDGIHEIVVDGKLINSDILNGLTVPEAKKKIIEEFEKLGIGHSKITYRLRDWLISRQRYWGCPIPMVYMPELKFKDEKMTDKSFSYLMGSEDINDVDLVNLNISYTKTDSETKKCIISNSKLEEYKKLVREKLSIGFWNEIISVGQIWFCFKDKIGNISEYVLNNENHNEVLAKCNEYVGKHRFDNLYDMFMDNEFYAENLVRVIKPVDEKYLPLKLPTDVEFKPTGESPIAHSESYKKLAEELYGVGARFEFDTCDTFIDSSWYYMRYLTPHDDTKAFDTELCNKWLPVDFYMIGPEHTVLHLMYSRFFTKFFYDQGLINYTEPFYKMRHQGMIQGADGRKMSKRFGNVINPSEVCEKYGADTLRVYEMFMGPLEQSKNWSEETIIGVRRFIDRVWNYAEKLNNKNVSTPKVKAELQKLIKYITANIPELKFNTCVAEFMKFQNLLEQEGMVISTDDFATYMKLLAPFAPFITDEIYNNLNIASSGEAGERSETEGVIPRSIHRTSWPNWDDSLIIEDKIVVGVQVNGKLRGEVEIEENDNENSLKEKVMKDENITRWLDGKEIKKFIYVKGKIVSIVV